MSSSEDAYSSLGWIIIPSIVVFSGWYARKWYLARRLRVHGIGKGAPGFQTNVRRVRVTPEIAARIRSGEDVSPDEIAQASRQAEEEELRKKNEKVPRVVAEEVGAVSTGRGKGKAKVETSLEEDNEWIPDVHKNAKRRPVGKRK